MIGFYLLGQSDCDNPNAISKQQLQLWEQEGIITYLGQSDDVRPFIMQSLCVVLPSFYKEGVPRILLEAMSMGKPIITANVAGCKECVAPPFKRIQNFLVGQNGILIAPKDRQALSQAMQYIQNLSLSQIKQMGKNGRAYAMSRFCISRIIQSYQCVVKNLKQSQNNPPNQAIAFVSNTCYGMYNFRLQVMRAFYRDGFEIHILAPLDSSSKALKREGFRLHHIDIDSKGLNPLKDIKSAYQIYVALKNIKPKIVFNYTIKPAIYGSFVANTLKLPNIAVITGLGYVFVSGGWKKRILRALVCGMYRVALFKTTQVWFLNPDDKAEFLQYKNISSHKARLLDSEGVDTTFFSPQVSLPPIQNLNCNQTPQHKEIIFLLVARMLWDKGVGEFVEAARMIKKSNTATSSGGGANIRFWLLGNLNVANPSVIPKSQIEQWHNEGIIEYLGQSDDVRPYLRASSCVVLPSYREGMPMSLLEAMSMGKPIITTNTSGCKELVRNGFNGFICEPKNAHSLYEAMQNFINTPLQQRQKIGKQSRQIVLRKYDKSLILKQYTQTLHSICQDKKS
ncbi:glycosyltransferase [Helicobacter fennelliae]|uniref:UDP-N-acetylgalactosaminyltransferase n=1 Tax=Helicobacter fennelliae MRY12-0050 TaxID=1325130 RepID=T1DV11_9HELI|nr:UDP-N-acetylgalactosaminyltransferase [Helicobacter fennelliae MRY12-0050]